MANAKVLKEWMKNDLHLEKVPEIDPSTFRRKLGTNSMSKAISWLTKHAKSKSKAETTKKLAALSILKENQNKLEAIQDSNKKLKLQMEETKSKNLRLQSDCDLLEKEVFNSNVSNVEELKIKTILLDAFVKKTGELINLLEEMVNALKVRQEKFYVDKHNSCDRNIWIEVEDILKQCEPKVIFEGLLTSTLEANERLKDRTANINILNDAENLKMKYNKGKLEDVSDSNQTLVAVKELIKEADGQFIRTFLDTEKLLNNSTQLQEKFNEKMEKCEKDLVESYSHNGLNTSRELLLSHIHLKSQEAQLQTAEKYKKRMEEKVKNLLSNKLKLEEKHKQIRNFSKAAQKKQKFIQILVKRNDSSSRSLPDWSNVKELIKQIDSLQQSVKDGVLCQQGSLEQELALFIEIDFENILVYDKDELKVINRMDGKKKLLPAYHSLNVCPNIYDSTELLTVMCRMVMFVLFSSVNSIETDTGDESRLKDCCTRLIQTQQEIKENMIIEIVNIVKRNNDLARYLNESQIVSIWWQKPALKIDTGEKINDKSLQQWLYQCFEGILRLRDDK
ncbi:DgyrCDS4796 [Dimorphilus gyrociliatus]|uniref:DgyrCDS4796 n=1 Tax=Dimorphilus gyrociliatus TaxID=2664684 RepID=A0A7I8VJG5_9ANNE|nr:DgyrCDS4796 [Dimorphilus gyrociliatus]